MVYCYLNFFFIFVRFSKDFAFFFCVFFTFFLRYVLNALKRVFLVDEINAKKTLLKHQLPLIKTRFSFKGFIFWENMLKDKLDYSNIAFSLI